MFNKQESSSISFDLDLFFYNYAKKEMIMEALTNEQISELSDKELEKVAGGVKLSDFMPKSFLDFYRSYKSAADTDEHARKRLIEYDKIIYEHYASFCASKGLDADPSKLIFDY